MLSVFFFILLSLLHEPLYFRKLFLLTFLPDIAGMNGVVISGDLFNIFVFLEISAISSYALVAFGVEKNELEATFNTRYWGDCILHKTFRYRTEYTGKQRP